MSFSRANNACCRHALCFRHHFTRTRNHTSRRLTAVQWRWTLRAAWGSTPTVGYEAADSYARHHITHTHTWSVISHDKLLTTDRQITDQTATRRHVNATDEIDRSLLMIAAADSNRQCTKTNRLKRRLSHVLGQRSTRTNRFIILTRTIYRQTAGRTFNCTRVLGSTFTNNVETHNTLLLVSLFERIDISHHKVMFANYNILHHRIAKLGWWPSSVRAAL